MTLDENHKSSILYKLIFILFLGLLCSQNILAINLYDISPVLSLVVLASKEMLVFTIVFIYFFLNFFLRLSLNRKELYLCFLLVLLALISIIHGNFVVFSVRQMMLIPILVVFGLITRRYMRFNKCFSYINTTLFFIAATGFLDIILFNRNEWFLLTLNVDKLSVIKGFDSWAFGPYGLPGNFYSFDLYFIFEDTVRRAVSILLEPTLLGQILVFPCFYYFLKRNYIAFLYFFVCILLALSKGGILGVILSCLLYYFSESRNKLQKSLVLTIMASFAGGVLILSYYLNVQSVINHIDGFVHNFSGLIHAPFGNGVGTVGNFAKIADISNDDIGSGESYVGTLIGQIGFIALIPFLIYLRLIFNIKTDNTKVRAVKYSTLSMLLLSFVSESAISFTGSSFLLVLSSYFIFRDTKNGKDIIFNNSAI